jgi:hypothetical protein
VYVTELRATPESPRDLHNDDLHDLVVLAAQIETDAS